jgi:hypothetical protein
MKEKNSGYLQEANVTTLQGCPVLGRHMEYWRKATGRRRGVEFEPLWVRALSRSTLGQVPMGNVEVLM